MKNTSRRKVGSYQDKILQDEKIPSIEEYNQGKRSSQYNQMRKSFARAHRTFMSGERGHTSIGTGLAFGNLCI